MLALTGEMGDGWLPTFEYFSRGAASLAGHNARIDDAAEAAGRSPSDVRRLMNIMRTGLSPVSRGMLDGPADQWIEQLAALALDDGVSGFLIGGDDLGVTERFGAEIAPAVRELVARERATR